MSQNADDSINKAKQQIRGLVGEIAQLSKSDLSPEEYHAAFLQRVIQALAAVGGAIWILGEGNRPQLSYQVNLSPNLLEKESDEAEKHSRLLDYIVASKQPQLIPPMSSAGDERMGGNPTRQLLVVAPLGHDGAVEGLIEIFQRADGQPATQRGYLRFLMQMCELASEWFKNRKLRQFTDRHSLWAQADQFSRAVHESLDIRETAYTIVNDGRKLMGCDRVSLAIKHGPNYLIDAVSGQDTLDNRSNVVTLLGKLATRVIATGEPLWYLGSTEDMPPQIEEAIEEYVDSSYTKSLAVIPLRRPIAGAGPEASGDAEGKEQTQGEILGALVIEQIESEIPREVLTPRLELVYEHSSRALSNAVEHNNLFLMPVWRAIGKSRWVVEARNLPRTLLIGGGVLAIVLALFVIPWPFDMRAKGTLEPIDKQDVFVPEDSRVTKVHVATQQEVAAGTVLVELESDELKQQLTELTGQMENASAEYGAVSNQLTKPNAQLTEQDRATLVSKQEQLRQRMATLEDRLDNLEKRAQRLKVASPFDGQVITWDPEGTLASRPVSRGSVLLTLAKKNSPWEVELYMPERRIEHLRSYQARVKKPLAVDFILMTEPGKSYSGVVAEIGGAAEMHDEQGTMVRVKVHLNEGEMITAPKPGTTVKADVRCGWAPLGYSLLHEAWEWVQANVLF